MRAFHRSAGARPEPVLRRANRGDQRELACVLARAFESDPVTNYLLRQDHKRDEARVWIFDTFARHIIMPNGEAWLATDGGKTTGVALWSPPGKWDIGVWRGAVMIPALARAVGLRGIRHALRSTHEVQIRHPKKPHWYLFAIGIDPARQGQGIGAALLRDMLGRIDKERACTYLEASSEASSRLYLRHGFETTEVVRMGRDSPPVFLMWREPR